MMLHEHKTKMEKTWAILLFPLMLLILLPGVYAEDNETAEVVDDEPVSLWGIGEWFISTTGYFMRSVSENGSSWFGIDPSIMIIFMLILFLYVLRAKANGWMFWVLILVVLFLVSSGAIPLENYI